MYDPKGNSRDHAQTAVSFVETEPPQHLAGVVHRYLEVRTHTKLTSDYRFHALPDACTYAVFNQKTVEIAGITRLQASSEELNLGCDFHFVNIRFLPGVWNTAKSPVAYGRVDKAYDGALPLVQTNETLIGQAFPAQQDALNSFVERLVDRNILIPNPTTKRFFARIDDIHTVGDMAEIARLSPRQLQRVMKSTTGLSPHDFLKILRLQQSLRGEPSLAYADQSHFIHSFKKATGYTPGQFARKFDV